MARAGTGGNQLPLIAYTVEKNESCIDRPEPYGREVHDEQERCLPDGDSAIRNRGGNTPIVIIDGETDEQTQQPDSVGCAEQTHLYD